MAAPPPPDNVSGDHRPSSPPPCASIIGPQHQGGSGSESESESELELDSPPRITFVAISKDQGPRSPTSPPGSPPPVHVNPPDSPLPDNVNPAGSPKCSSDEEDPYFESLVDNFTYADDDDIDCKALAQRQRVLYAESALKRYNNDEKNEIKYELISAITSNDILCEEGCFGHVNFTAKGNKQDSMEELFFAELRWDGDTLVPTCVVSLEGIKSVGGLRGSKYDNFYLDVLPIDTQHCYDCNRRLKHPKNGELYQMGHVPMSTYYMGVV